MSPQPIELPIVRVAGDPAEMGRAQGEAVRERVRAFIDVRFAAVEQYTREKGRPSGADGLLAVGARGLEMQKVWDPIGYAEHLGIAAGARVDPVALYTAANMTDLRDALLLRGSGPDAEGCTALMVPPALSASGEAIVGQTWDLNATDLDFVIAVHREPLQGPATWSVTCAGCLTLMGHNADGLAVGTTNLKTWGARPGVGYLSILHRMLRESTAEAAAAVVASAPRAGAHLYWAADAKMQLDLEADPTGVARREAGQGALCHTNHCLDDDFAARQGEGASDSSASRLGFMAEALSHGGQTVERVQALFADRSRGALSVNRYPEDGGEGATNAVFIAMPARRQAWACRGPADRGRWHVLDFG
ncbi:MAG: hypothetical protein KC620_19500 [Myxococcales bacterium]|nr:hypothetical protein [Myxococcales bacterium]